MLISRHTEDEACPILGKVWLRLVDSGFHGDGAFPTMHAALDWIGDAHLQAAFLTAGRDKHERKRVRKGSGGGACIRHCLAIYTINQRLT